MPAPQPTPPKAKPALKSFARETMHDPTSSFPKLPEEEDMARAVVLAKRGVGRPSSYLPEYCDRVVELGAEGKSVVQISVELGHLRKTLYEWAERYPDFGTALARARELSQSWWETQAKIGIWEGTPKGRLNAHVWLRSMAARFPEDYRESTRTEITGKDGGPVSIVKMSDTELLAIAASGKPSADTK